MTNHKWQKIDFLSPPPLSCKHYSNHYFYVQTTIIKNSKARSKQSKHVGATWSNIVGWKYHVVSYWHSLYFQLHFPVFSHEKHVVLVDTYTPKRLKCKYELNKTYMHEVYLNTMYNHKQNVPYACGTLTFIILLHQIQFQTICFESYILQSCSFLEVVCSRWKLNSYIIMCHHHHFSPISHLMMLFFRCFLHLLQCMEQNTVKLSINFLFTLPF